jgi:hypothetical protein
MAKGQQRSNKEAKKPKKAKPSKPTAGSNYGQIKPKKPASR